MDAVQKTLSVAARSVHLACTDNQKQQGTGSAPGCRAQRGAAAGSGVGRSAHARTARPASGEHATLAAHTRLPVSQLSTGATALH